MRFFPMTASHSVPHPACAGVTSVSTFTSFGHFPLAYALTTHRTDLVPYITQSPQDSPWSSLGQFTGMSRCFHTLLSHPPSDLCCDETKLPNFLSLLHYFIHLWLNFSPSFLLVHRVDGLFSSDNFSSVSVNLLIKASPRPSACLVLCPEHKVLR